MKDFFHFFFFSFFFLLGEAHFREGLFEADTVIFKTGLQNGSERFRQAGSGGRVAQRNGPVLEGSGLSRSVSFPAVPGRSVRAFLLFLPFPLSPSFLLFLSIDK